MAMKHSAKACKSTCRAPPPRDCKARGMWTRNTQNRSRHLDKTSHECRNALIAKSKHKGLQDGTVEEARTLQVAATAFNNFASKGLTALARLFGHKAVGRFGLQSMPKNTYSEFLGKLAILRTKRHGIGQPDMSSAIDFSSSGSPSSGSPAHYK